MADECCALIANAPANLQICRTHHHRHQNLGQKVRVPYVRMALHTLLGYYGRLLVEDDHDDTVQLSHNQ